MSEQLRNCCLNTWVTSSSVTPVNPVTVVGTFHPFNFGVSHNLCVSVTAQFQFSSTEGATKFSCQWRGFFDPFSIGFLSSTLVIAVSEHCPSSKLLIGNVVSLDKGFLTRTGSMIVTPSSNHWFEFANQRYFGGVFMPFDDVSYFSSVCFEC